MKRLDDEIIDGDHTDRLMYLLMIGRKNFTERGIWGKNVLSMENFGKNSIILPPVCLGDGYITHIPHFGKVASKKPNFASRQSVSYDR